MHDSTAISFSSSKKLSSSFIYNDQPKETIHLEDGMVCSEVLTNLPNKLPIPESLNIINLLHHIFLMVGMVRVKGFS